MPKPVAPTWTRHARALGCYLLMALAATYPLPLRLGDRVIANAPGQNDAYLGIWNIWWAAQAITALRDPFVTPLLFYPQGLDLFWQTLSLPQGLLALPFTLALGPLPAYNLLILASFVLGGYFAYLFARAALQGEGAGPARDLAALLAGAVYAFAPFHMQKVLDAQLEVAGVQWLPLWAWASLRLLERRRWPYALLAAAALLWVGLGTWYYGLFALIGTGLMAGLWSLDRCAPAGGAAPPRRWQIPEALPLRFSRIALCLRPRVLLWGLAPIIIWLAVMAPRLLQLASVGDTLLGDVRNQQYDSVADLVSFWLPNPNHPLWGPALSAWYQARYPQAILWNISLGVVGTLLALAGLATAWRAQWRWLALGAVAAAFALGPELHVLGVQTGIPMPYSLIRDLPGVRSSHRPNHFVLISILTTALFAAQGALALLRRSRRPGLLAGGLLAALLAIDGWAGPAPLYARPMPAFYQTMPAGGGALLPVPLHLNFANAENLWYQTVHRRPIVGGFIGREPPYPLGRYAPGVAELRFGRAEPDDILSPGWPELARESLAAYGIEYVMYHRVTMGSSLPAMSDLIAEMGLAPSHSDELLSVYPVPRPAEPRPLAYLGAGWGELEGQGGQRWRWMGESAEVYLLNPGLAPRTIRLTIAAEAYERERTLTLRLGQGAPFSLPISRARMERSLHLILPPGEHVLYLGAPADSPPGQPSRRLSLAVLGLTIED